MKNQKNTQQTVIPRQIPEISPAEFAYIRRQAGYSYRTLAKKIGGVSFQTIRLWEIVQEKMKLYQIRALRDSLGDELFDSARKLWESIQTNSK